jgi:hypothetical protein
VVLQRVVLETPKGFVRTPLPAMQPPTLPPWAPLGGQMPQVTSGGLEGWSGAGKGLPTHPRGPGRPRKSRTCPGSQALLAEPGPHHGSSHRVSASPGGGKRGCATPPLPRQGLTSFPNYLRRPSPSAPLFMAGTGGDWPVGHGARSPRTSLAGCLKFLGYTRPGLHLVFPEPPF